MKTLLKSLILTLFLAGCALQPVKFDSAEYLLYVSLAQQTNQLHASCGKPLVEQSYLEQLGSTVDRLQIYAAHRPVQFSKDYANTINEMLLTMHSGGSVAYCQLSADNLLSAVTRILDTIGSRVQ